MIKLATARVATVNGRGFRTNSASLFDIARIDQSVLQRALPTRLHSKSDKCPFSIAVSVMTAENTMPRPVGAVLHSPILYDAIVWFALRGRERQLRRRLLELSGLRLGESVLDVGCGTGTLAILAKETVGLSGSVHGVDPSPEMLARARAKAARARAQIRFESGSAQALPAADSSFDLALSTMMLHHLGPAGRRELAAELRRVVKPGGRVLLVDFAKSAMKDAGFTAHFRHRHGHVAPSEIVGLLDGAGFRPVESGAVGIKDLHFALGRAPMAVNFP